MRKTYKHLAVALMALAPLAVVNSASAQGMPK